MAPAYKRILVAVSFPALLAIIGCSAGDDRPLGTGTGLVAQFDDEDIYQALGIDPDNMTDQDQEAVRMERFSRAAAHPYLTTFIQEIGATTSGVFDYLPWDTYISELYPDNNFGDAAGARIGRRNGGYNDGLFASYVCPPGVVVKAALWVKVTQDMLTDYIFIAVEGLSGLWGENTVTWNNAPGGAGDLTVAAVFPPLGDWIGIPATEAVRDVCVNGADNFGLRVSQFFDEHLGYFDIATYDAYPIESKTFLAMYYDPGTPVSPNDTCSLPATIPVVPGFVHQNNEGDTDDYAGSCGGGGSPDVVFSFLAFGGYSYKVTLQGSGNQDTVLYVRQSPCASGIEVACNDDFTTTPSYSVVQFTPPTSGTYYVFVDGNGGASGHFNLSISTVTTTTTVPTTTTTTTTTGEADDDTDDDTGDDDTGDDDTGDDDTDNDAGDNDAADSAVRGDDDGGSGGRCGC